jgi:hypothetical protein
VRARQGGRNAALLPRDDGSWRSGSVRIRGNILNLRETDAWLAAAP